MAPRGIKAIVFDLYDTLITTRRRLLHKRVPRLLGASAAKWVGLIREDLLTAPFENRAGFVRFICEKLAGRHEADERLLALVHD